MLVICALHALCGSETEESIAMTTSEQLVAMTLSSGCMVSGRRALVISTVGLNAVSQLHVTNGV